MPDHSTDPGTTGTARVESSTDSSVFEGLARVLKPTGAFADDLRAAGFDPDHLQPRYHPSVLLATLDVAARHRYPHLSRELAHRTIGLQFAEGYFQTIFGRMTRTLVQFLGLERFITQIPRTAAIATPGLTVEVNKVAPGEYRLVFRTPYPSAEFSAGALEGLSGKRTTLRAEVVRRETGQYELKVLLADGGAGAAAGKT
jgi:uncharacterized protein (TIGR02265 family)